MFVGGTGTRGPAGRTRKSRLQMQWKGSGRSRRGSEGQWKASGRSMDGTAKVNERAVERAVGGQTNCTGGGSPSSGVKGLSVRM